MSVHLHVGHNIPGYLPETDPTCHDSYDSALGMLKIDIRYQQESYWDSCESIGEYGFENCECPWCDAASDCEAILSSIADGEAAYWIDRVNTVDYTVRPDRGPDITYWVAKVEGNCDGCELNEDDQ